jgi:subtilisin family serine protease
MSQHNRRTFLKVSGALLGGLTVGTGPAYASTDENQRFLVDLREVDRTDVPDGVDIIHDLAEIDLLAARGNQDDVPGAASTIPDVTVYQHGSSPKGGPVQEVNATEPGNMGPAWDSGPPTPTELQWDKREQRVGDLTERPDNKRDVHDTTKGEGTRVAVVDTGVYDGHPDLADVVNEDLSENFTTDQYDWRPNGAGDHGTHVAGIIAGTNASGNGILGTAPETEIVSHRVFSGEAGATGDSLAALYSAALKGCDVANFSVGYPYPYVDPEEYPWLLKIKVAYERLAAYARKKGMTIVNSAGNDGLDMTPEGILSLPTEAEGIFGVSATGPIGYLWDDTLESREDISLKTLEDPTSSPAFYTNYGSAVDVSAAGGDADLEAIGKGIPGWYYDLVFSTIVQYDDNGNPVPGYGWKAGTSMSAPQVSGAYALVRSLRPDASPDEVESLIQATAEHAPGGELYHGAGHLNLRRLVREASNNQGRR